MKRAAFLGLIVAPLLACTSATEPLPTVSASVTQVAVHPEVSGSPGMVDLKLKLVIENPAEGPVYYSSCAVALERRDASLQWQNIWSPVCLLISGYGSLEIGGGRTLETPVHVRAYGDGVRWPSSGLDGSYRLVVGVFGPRPVSRRVSPSNVKFAGWRLFTNEFRLP